MNRTDLNKIMTNLRVSHPTEYKKLKQKWKHYKISRKIDEILTTKVFKNYEQIKSECPASMKIGYFLLKIIR